MFKTKHEFAFYYSAVSHIQQKRAHINTHDIIEPDLFHRLINVLRLEKNDQVILFDSQFHIEAHIIQIGKKSVTLDIENIIENTILTPRVNWLLPVLKRDAYEQALYALTELGVTSIQPILTDKLHKIIITEKELIRHKKIIIAAAEQAKQFVVPELKPLVPLSLYLPQIAHNNQSKIFFDPTGKPCFEIVKQLAEHNIKEIIACAGPEGDLTPAEKAILHNHDFTFCKLTPTILRAEQAAIIGLGIIRSLLN
jgi:16S rRNA (uracil1498-N3)-methyltransferase